MPRPRRSTLCTAALMATSFALVALAPDAGAVRTEVRRYRAGNAVALQVACGEDRVTGGEIGGTCFSLGDADSTVDLRIRDDRAPISVAGAVVFRFANGSETEERQFCALADSIPVPDGAVAAIVAVGSSDPQLGCSPVGTSGYVQLTAR